MSMIRVRSTSESALPSPLALDPKAQQAITRRPCNGALASMACAARSTKGSTQPMLARRRNDLSSLASTRDQHISIVSCTPALRRALRW